MRVAEAEFRQRISSERGVATASAGRELDPSHVPCPWRVRRPSDIAATAWGPLRLPIPIPKYCLRLHWIGAFSCEGLQQGSP